MLFEYNDENTDGVALLTEGVDRNSPNGQSKTWQTTSPSSRRAWIEL